MKKFIISLLLLSAVSTVARAQDFLLDNPDNRPYLGVRIGVDVMALQSPSDMYGNSGGFFVGAIYNMPLWKNLYFEPGLHLFYNSAKIKESINYSNNDLLRSTGSINDWGFRIPFNFGYHFDITDNLQIMPFTGPQLDVNISNSTNYDVDVFYNPYLHYNTFDFGWNFGVGVKYESLFASLGGTVGMSHYIKNDDRYNTAARRNLFTIAIGYNF